MSSLVSAIAVSAVGIIGFVGLVVPHLSRALFPIGSKVGIVATFVIGATLLLWCDILSRLLYAPTGLPIGVISAFLGLPFFLYLLQNKTYRF
jgi:iron complex transport system permease protein